MRYNKRISSGNDKLKDMKNDINLARVHFSQYIVSMQENNQELGNIDSTQNYSSSDVLNIVAEEVEQIVSNLQTVQEKVSHIVFSYILFQFHRLLEYLSLILFTNY